MARDSLLTTSLLQVVNRYNLGVFRLIPKLFEFHVRKFSQLISTVLGGFFPPVLLHAQNQRIYDFCGQIGYQYPKYCHVLPSRSLTLAWPCLTWACHAMPCHAMPCHAMPCHAMPCHAMPCHAIPYHIPCHTIPYTLPYLFLRG